MNVLDENILESQRQLLRGWRVPVRQIGHELAHKGLPDLTWKGQFASREQAQKAPIKAPALAPILTQRGAEAPAFLPVERRQSHAGAFGHGPRRRRGRTGAPTCSRLTTVAIHRARTWANVPA